MAVSRVPDGEDWITRKFRELGEALQSLRSAVAGISAIREQVAFLAGQQTVVSRSNTYSLNTTGPADTTYAFNPAFDPAITLTTSSTGTLAVQLSAQISLDSDPANVNGTFGAVTYDVLRDGVLVPGFEGWDATVPPTGARLSARARGLSATLTSSWMTAQLQPNTTYTLRARARAAIYLSGAVGTVQIRAISMSVIKIGM